MRLNLIVSVEGTAASLMIIASIPSVPARADTVDITYNNVGGLTAAPVLNRTMLTLNAIANGSILFDNPGLDAIWIRFRENGNSQFVKLIFSERGAANAERNDRNEHPNYSAI